MDRSGFWLLVSLVVVGLVPVASALHAGEAIVGAASVAFCLVVVAVLALFRELRAARARPRRGGDGARRAADAAPAAGSRW